MATTTPTVGLHEDTESIVSALVSRARIVTGMDIASAAVRDADGLFPMTVNSGIRSEAFRSLRIKTGRRPGRAGAAQPVSRSGCPTTTAPR